MTRRTRGGCRITDTRGRDRDRSRDLRRSVPSSLIEVAPITAVSLIPERAAPVAMPRAVDVGAERRESAPRPIEAGAEQGLRAIVAAESGFDVARFLEGAKAAYRMTLEAFWRGDEAELRDPQAHAVTVVLQHLDAEPGADTEVVRAKYVLGSDGALRVRFS